MTDGPFLVAYRDVLPACQCFELGTGEAELREAAQLQLTQATELGEMVAEALACAGVCPVAMPNMLSVVMSSAAVNLSMMHEAAMPPEQQQDTPLALIPEVRRLLDTVAALLPAHVARAERIALESMGPGGVAGSC